MRHVFGVAPLVAVVALGVGTGPGADGSVRLDSAAATVGIQHLDGWTVDKVHSAVNFTVRHFFTPVRGSFEEFEIALLFNEVNPGASSVTVSVPVASVDTKNEKRDNHLRSDDFLGAETFPRMKFQSTAVRQAGEGALVVEGDLTIKDVTKKVSLDVRLLGVQEIPAEMQESFGGTKKVASFEGTTRIDRRDFGVGTGRWVETTIVGADVEIQILIEAHLK